MVKSEEQRISSRTNLRGMAGLVSSVLAGACIVFALPPYSILPLGMVAFAVLSLLLRDAAPMRALGLGYLFGLGQFVPGLFWVTESFQVDADRFGWLRRRAPPAST